MANKKRLIDADALMKAIKSFRWVSVPGTLKLLFDYLKIIIDGQPTVEQGNGKWINEDWGDWRCSACRNLYSFDDYGDIHPLDDCGWNYCPNCGAKMDGGNEDD